MKLCIPVTAPEGLNSIAEPNLPHAEHLLFFDTETRQYEHVSLNEQRPGAAADFQMDAVFFGVISRVALRALIEQGIKVYGIGSQPVAQVIAQFENGELEAVSLPEGGCGGHGKAQGHAGGGCCSGKGHADHDHAHGEGGHGCGGGGCGGHSHEHGHEGGGCCGGKASQGDAAPAKASGDTIRIAVCSQNRETVTEHAGKCRKFWIYEVKRGQLVGRSLLELPIEQALHSSPPGQPHPLDDVNILLGASMGSGLQQRLMQRGIEGVVTVETDPDQAVAALLAGKLERMPPDQEPVAPCAHGDGGAHVCETVAG